MREEKSLSRVDLSEVEKESYKEWKKEKVPPLPLAASLKGYELFLNSYSCDDIARISGCPLGQVVDARLRYSWDQTRDEQLKALYAKIEERVLVTKSQALAHVTDLLAAAHKFQGEKIKKYLYEDDPNALGDLRIATVKDYREIVNLLVALTSPQQGGKIPNTPSGLVSVSGKVEHTHTVQKDSKPEALDVLKGIEDAELVNDDG